MKKQNFVSLNRSADSLNKDAGTLNIITRDSMKRYEAQMNSRALSGKPALSSSFPSRPKFKVLDMVRAMTRRPKIR